MINSNLQIRQTLKYLGATIFWSRWLQAPLYLGLIAVLGLYAYEFLAEL